MKDSKELILSRIREALKTTAPIPGGHDYSHWETTPSRPKPDLKSFDQWLPSVEDDFSSQWNLLTKSFQALKTDFGLLDSTSHLIDFVQELQRTENWKRIGFHRGELTSLIADSLQTEKILVDAPYSSQDLEKCDVGITECDAIVAQTGSILITARSAGGRGLSALPPHH
ncbi:MAG: LUD domain-containing protein, partial [Verrucomicrobiota bacterium]